VCSHLFLKLSDSVLLFTVVYLFIAQSDDIFDVSMRVFYHIQHLTSFRSVLVHLLNAILIETLVQVPVFFIIGHIRIEILIMIRLRFIIGGQLCC